MNTDLAKDFGLEFPIFAFTHCRDVAAAVSKAGGLGVLGVAGQELADREPATGHRDRLEGATDLGRCVWFQIPHVDMTGAPLEHDEDTGLDLRLPATGGIGLEVQESRQGETSQQPGSSQGQGIPA